MHKKQNIPPLKLYINALNPPPNIQEIIILKSNIKNVSFAERVYMAKSVTVFARPSFIPGIGARGGI